MEVLLAMFMWLEVTEHLAICNKLLKANYVSYIWKHADKANPDGNVDPVENGWKLQLGCYIYSNKWYMMVNKYQKTMPSFGWGRWNFFRHLSLIGYILRWWFRPFRNRWIDIIARFKLQRKISSNTLNVLSINNKTDSVCIYSCYI